MTAGGALTLAAGLAVVAIVTGSSPCSDGYFMSQIRCAADAARKAQQVDLAAMEAALERLNTTVRTQAAQLGALREQLGSHPDRNLALNRPANSTRVSLSYVASSPHCAPGNKNFWCAPPQSSIDGLQGQELRPGRGNDGRTNNGVPVDSLGDPRATCVRVYPPACPQGVYSASACKAKTPGAPERAFWYVDLGAEYFVTHVRITGASSRAYSRYLRVQVSPSLARGPGAQAVPSGAFCGGSKNVIDARVRTAGGTYRDPASAHKYVQESCGVFGRYVFVSSAHAHLGVEFCELEAFGSGRDGYEAQKAKLAEQRVLLAQMARSNAIAQVTGEQERRMRGSSGIAQVRSYGGGGRDYHEASFSNAGILSIHNHANNIRTIGMGEFTAVLNGVTFSTRHNDYRLRMAPTNDKTYGRLVDVPFPQVPARVLNAGSVSQQTAEMKEWFRAWQAQQPGKAGADGVVRDYRPYFKPVLCVVEGAWITDNGNLDEPFYSDRHHIEAKDWADLHDKTRFLFNSGRKNNLENLPFLPNAIRAMGGANGTVPVYSNFEYRIHCQPLKDDLPLNRFRVAPDLHLQRFHNAKQDAAEIAKTRRARFELNPADSDTFNDNRRNYQLIDRLMEQVAGKDNHGANLSDTFYKTPALHYEKRDPAATYGYELLNTAYYSRMYQLGQTDAMGRDRRKRGFNDPHLYAAMTSQERVSALGAEDDTGDLLDPSCTQGARCAREPSRVTQRWTWAIPLEVIYLTPLTRWNPYNLSMMSDRDATSGGRVGSTVNPARAYNGISERNFFMTPEAFFSGSEAKDPADTSGGTVGVLDRQGNIQRTRASGHWVLFPEIAGVGKNVRQRYPIAPIHEEGNTVWKELKALQDDLIEATNAEAAAKAAAASAKGKNVYLELTFALGHQHTIELNEGQLAQLQTRTIEVQSTHDNAHVHDCVIGRNATTGDFYLVSMDPYEPHLLKVSQTEV